mmetsp:Transcript_53302/g.130174  ORF Transcript_53302/g.130174 Transcript_53302/m.130174 type:complete len:201 (+) Transcript_53302:48-650(+)
MARSARRPTALDIVNLRDRHLFPWLERGHALVRARRAPEGIAQIAAPARRLWLCGCPVAVLGKLLSKPTGAILAGLLRLLRPLGSCLPAPLLLLVSTAHNAARQELVLVHQRAAILLERSAPRLRPLAAPLLEHLDLFHQAPFGCQLPENLDSPQQLLVHIHVRQVQLGAQRSLRPSQQLLAHLRVLARLNAREGDPQCS